MRRILAVAIACFAIWHAVAIGIFAIPREANDSFARLSRITLLPVVSPYVWLTGQWQQWNLFSPNPDAQSKDYVFEWFDGQNWQQLTSLHRGSYSILRHATRFKLLRNLFLPYGQSDLAARYLQSLCQPFDLAPGTPIRVMVHLSTPHGSTLIQEGTAASCLPKT